MNTVDRFAILSNEELRRWLSARGYDSQDLYACTDDPNTFVLSRRDLETLGAKWLKETLAS